MESLEEPSKESLLDLSRSSSTSNFLRGITNPLYYICYQGQNDVTLLRKYYDYYKSRNRITDISLDIEELPSLKNKHTSIKKNRIRINSWVGFVQPYYDNNFHSISRVCNGIIQRLVSKNDTHRHRHRHRHRHKKNRIRINSCSRIN